MKNVYILKQIKKSEGVIVETENTILGYRYVVLHYFQENKQYLDVREQHLVFNLGLNPIVITEYKNPILLNEDGSKIIYLKDFYECYITLQDGTIIENLSNYVHQYLETSDSKTFADKQSQIIQKEYERKMEEKALDQAMIPAEDVLQRPANYSLYQIFDRLKAGRKRADQLLLQDLMDHLSSDGTFDIIDSKDLDDYNTIVTLMIENHLTEFKEADVRYKFKENQLLNRGY